MIKRYDSKEDLGHGVFGLTASGAEFGFHPNPKSAGDSYAVRFTTAHDAFAMKAILEFVGVCDPTGLVDVNTGDMDIDPCDYGIKAVFPSFLDVLNELCDTSVDYGYLGGWNDENEKRKFHQIREKIINGNVPAVDVPSLINEI